MILPCVLFLLFGFSDCSLWLQDYFITVYNGDYESNVSESIVGYNPLEQDEDILRPCHFADFHCIRDFLASNSQCNPTYGSTPDPLRIPISKFYFPSINITIKHTNGAYRGFKDVKITEFYLNNATGNVVIAFNIPNLNFTAKKSYFTYQRIRKEPITLADWSTYQPGSMTFTAAIPKVPYLSLDKADIHASVFGQLKFFVGPKAFDVKDPSVLAEFEGFEEKTPLIVKEAFSIDSYYLMTTFIQRELCDFGVIYLILIKYLDS